MPTATDEPDAEVAEGIVRTTAVNELRRAPERKTIRRGNGLIEADLELDDLEPLEPFEPLLLATRSDRLGRGDRRPR